ncbi:MAG TPA: hypothetical protein VJN50_09750 [Actinomycetota bacterium]|nr:hypothetical protein [Actinomycetota bacterium]
MLAQQRSEELRRQAEERSKVLRRRRARLPDLRRGLAAVPFTKPVVSRTET